MGILSITDADNIEEMRPNLEKMAAVSDILRQAQKEFKTIICYPDGRIEEMTSQQMLMLDNTKKDISLKQTIIKKLRYEIDNKFTSYEEKCCLLEILKMIEMIGEKCPKCHYEKYSMCSVACHCWMLETGKITQKQYDEIIRGLK